MKKPHNFWNNRILCVIVPVLLCLLTVQAVRGGVLTSLALEQPVCCGMEEHVHNDACYLDTILICGKKAHTHGENCYLILLQDNNINWLLREVDRAEDKNLASVLRTVVTQAMAAGEGNEPGVRNLTAESLVFYASETGGSASAVKETVPTESQPQETLTAGTEVVSTVALESNQISELNDVIEENGISPAVVLNESLASVSYTVTLAAENDGTAAANIVDDTAGSGVVNFYVYFVDEDGTGSWTFIGSESHTTVRTGGRNSRTYYAVPTSDILTLMNDALGTEYSSLPAAYYATSATASTRTATGSVTSQRVTYTTLAQTSSSSNTFHVYLGAGGRSASAEPELSFCRVTCIYLDGTRTVTYHETGEAVTLPALEEGYVWQNQRTDETYAGGTTITLDKSYTLEEILTGYTVTFVTNGGTTVANQTVREGNTVTKPAVPTRAGHTFAGWYSDAALTTAYDFNTAVTSHLTLYARWNVNTYSVTYLNLSGEQIGYTAYDYGTIITLDVPPTGANSWKDTAEAVYYGAGTRITVDRDYVFRAVTTYTVTLRGTGGEILSTTSVVPGESFTLAAPDGNYVWVDESGNTYAARTDFVVNSNLTFIQKGYLRIQYNIGWDTAAAAAVSLSSGSYTEPTVMNGRVYTHTLAQGATETICAISDREITVNFPLPSGSVLRPGIAVFQGWQVTDAAGTTHTFRIGEVRTYSNLLAYAVDGEVTFTGLWTYTKTHSTAFFVEYDSRQDSSANAAEWTPVLYVNQYITADGTSSGDISISNVSDQDGDGDIDNYDVDARLRSMVESGEVSGFPTDEYVFETLKNYTDASNGGTILEVDGIPVDAADLNEHGYTILWTKLAWVPADGDYHVDGILIRKTGYLYVNKTFSGNTEAVETVKNGDYAIKAVSGEDGQTVLLNLSPYDQNSNPGGYISGGGNSYTWMLQGVAYGEAWTFTEENYEAEIAGLTVSPYMEYTVSDALGSQSRHGEHTGSVTVTGQTYDSTISTDEVLTVSFGNIYPGIDSFVLKKEDSDTGNALAGAAFSLYQNGKRLSFKHNSGIYTCAEDGTVTELDCTEGFLEITVQGLDFTQGNITVKEIRTPEGYLSLADAVELTKVEGSIVVSGGNSTAARMANGVLIIGNTSTTATVTAVKKWTNEEDARDVVVNLMANGSLVTTLFPDLTGISAVVTLNESGNYTYTWKNLPAYADGQLINWSVTETRIGEERAAADGSFDNWTVLYAPPVTGMDAEGNAQVTLTITNARKAGNALVIYKTDGGGGALAGAQFRLQMLNASGTVSTDFDAQTGTTNDNGLLTFTGLPFGNYQLSEIAAPSGYTAAEMIRFTVNADMTVTVTDDGNGAAEAVPDALVIRVANYPSKPLPATGGSGPVGYYAAGMLFMLIALCVAILPKPRVEGRYRKPR